MKRKCFEESTIERETMYPIDTSELKIIDSLNFAYKSIDNHNEHLIHLKFYKKSNKKMH